MPFSRTTFTNTWLLAVQPLAFFTQTVYKVVIFGEMACTGAEGFSIPSDGNHQSVSYSAGLIRARKVS